MGKLPYRTGDLLYRADVQYKHKHSNQTVTFNTDQYVGGLVPSVDQIVEVNGRVPVMGKLIPEWVLNWENYDITPKPGDV